MRTLKHMAITASAMAIMASVTPAAAQVEMLPAHEEQLDAAKAAMMGDSAEALRLAREVKIAASDDTVEAHRARLSAQWLEGEALIRLNRVDEAQAIIEQAIAEASDAFANDQLYADLLRSQASLMAHRGEYGLALSAFLEAHDRYQQLGETRSQAIVLQNIGSLYSDARDYERVMRYYRQATEAHTDDPALALSAHNNVGNALKELGRLGEAETEFGRALYVAKDMGSPTLEARILTNIASTQYNREQYGEAMTTVERGLRIAAADAPEWLPFLYGVRGQIHLATGQTQRARADISRTFTGQDIESSSPYFRDFHQTAYQIFSRTGDNELALRHLSAFHRIDGQARDLSAEANSALLAARFDAESNELRISKLSAEKEASEARLTATQNKVWLLTSVVLLVIAAFLAALITLRVVNRSKRAISEVNNKLTYVIQHDGLTGLFSRDHFHALLEKEAQSAKEDESTGVLMLIDLDRFKQVNDKYGHAAGDHILVKTAMRFREAAGPDATIGRLGGDEFALFMPHPFAMEDAAEVAQAIIDRVSVPFQFEGHEIMVGASIGMAAIGAKDRNTSALITNADLALYEAKRQGRGIFVKYALSMRDTLEERTLIENDLGRALEKGELSISYQPIVDGVDGHTRCLEALMRWNHPTRGEVSPEIFVPVAEDALLIDKLGAWLLRTACQDAAAWDKSIKLTVNVSALQLSSGVFLPTVIEALAYSGLEPERLVLELTESVVLEMDEEVERLARSLNELGVTFALDDFGRGYSSLNYIEKMQFSMIKIDRDFVQAAAAGSQKSLAVVAAIVSLAESLGIDVTAEGIEGIEQADAMRALGCSCFQGFHFGRPEPLQQAPLAMTA
ncbi:EAL domain-containing protein [Aurantiacibacter aquimixticola]|uniref:EAL domain-containing protein n=1 Tax=Aurantiacibacter aquimixticola TaxID=1958945 RepID=A0A419RVS0_9SPHN|nr:EAL domain-containing protein [Aurantiacibacter aquimixticola]RJY09878.1 EAL domain-containing protein [Aurantiacibacter aquimixticola]